MSVLQDIRDKRGAFIIAEVGVNYYDIAAKNSLSVMEGAELMIDRAALAGRWLPNRAGYSNRWVQNHVALPLCKQNGRSVARIPSVRNTAHGRAPPLQRSRGSMPQRRIDRMEDGTWRWV